MRTGEFCSAYGADGNFGLRKAVLSDIPAMRQLFQHTVLTVNTYDYTPEEAADWAACGDEEEHWRTLMEKFHFVVAEDRLHRMVGFASVNAQGYLHSMFVRADCQHRGVATLLLEEMERYARTHGAKTMTSDVSLTAEPFFKHQGYAVVKRKRQQARRLWLANTLMEKRWES